MYFETENNFFGRFWVITKICRSFYVDDSATEERSRPSNVVLSGIVTSYLVCRLFLGLVIIRIINAFHNNFAIVNIISQRIFY